MIKTFEKDGCKYEIGELKYQDGLWGNVCKKFEWDREVKGFIFINQQFIPSQGMSNLTKAEVAACFETGSHFVYLKKRYRYKKSFRSEDED